MVGRSFQQLCRLVLREPTRDLYCGFKLWRAQAAVDAYSRTRLEGWTFDAEVLAMARALGYRLCETGIVWTDREGSRVRMARILVPVVRELVRRPAARPQRSGPAAAGDPCRRAGPDRERRRRERAVSASAEAPAAPLSTQPPNRTAPGFARLDRFEAVVLAALLALALAPLAGLLVRVWTQGGVVTGGDGFLVADPLQYLTWLREAGEHVAVANLYDLEDGPRSFVHPGVVISGLLHQLGLGVVAAYMVWKPVAVLALFAGALALCRRFLTRPGDRVLALVLALFFASPVAALVGWAGIGGEETKFDLDFISGELWAGTYLWGYLFTAIAVGLMPLGLLAYERGRGRRHPAAARPRSRLWPHRRLAPALAGSHAHRRARGSRAVQRASRALRRRRCGATSSCRSQRPPPRSSTTGCCRAATASWELAGVVNDFPRWPWWVTLLGLLPLAVPAAFAYRLPAPDFASVALRIWPLAGLAIFYQPAGTFPFHAFQGLSLPLAVLGRARPARPGSANGASPSVGPSRRCSSCAWWGWHTAQTSCGRRSTSGASPSS